MIRVVVLTDDQKNVGLEVSGHAGYADRGYDIICSAVSVLTINLANSVEQFTEDQFTCLVTEETGEFSFRLEGAFSKEAGLLLDSCILGIRDVAREYGKEFIKITVQEVK